MTDQTTVRSDAFTPLAEQLSPEQKMLLIEIGSDLSAEGTAECEAVALEMARHLASPTIVHTLLYQHVIDQRPALRGRCCSGTPVEGEYRYI